MTYHLVILLEEGTYNFYARIGEAAGLPVETVASDALLKLAGELSIEAMDSGERQAFFEAHAPEQ